MSSPPSSNENRHLDAAVIDANNEGIPPGTALAEAVDATQAR